MRSAWSDSDAQAAIERYTAEYGPACNEDVALRTYSARLIGSEPSLVLHGGGNTSVKTRLVDDAGQAVDVICVKGSGWDLATIEPPGHPAVRLGTLAALRELDALSDEDMVNAARVRLLDSRAPNPSVELLLHAFLPHKFIDHSHADAILSLVDQEDAAAICAEVFGERLALVPYIMPGFALSKLAAEVHGKHPEVEGLLLHQHGLFTFGDSARESYERHIEAVTRAEEFIASRRSAVASVAPAAGPELTELLLALRGALGAQGRRYVLHARTSGTIRQFVDDPALGELAGRGPATPDHVIRTKARPLVLTDLAELDARLTEYREAYGRYFSEQVEAKGVERIPLDPDPRIVLVPGVGIVAAGATEKAARVAADVYEHTIDVIRGGDAVGQYRALGDGDLFDMEYWSLEQAKLGKKAPRALESHVVYVTGAASGIGAAVARCFAGAGAHLFLVDREEAVQGLADELGAAWAVVDVADEAAVARSIEAAVLRYGGLDGVVSNAGVAPQSPIHEVTPDLLRRSFDVNLFGHQWVAAAATDVMRRQGTGGFLLFNASKAAFNPGADFGPYALPKAALVALMKQYALEGGSVGIRANAVNADRVRTGLLPPEFVEQRAKARGLEPDQYFRSNLLQREVTADDVAQAFLHLAQAHSTTGTVLTVDVWQHRRVASLEAVSGLGDAEIDGLEVGHELLVEGDLGPVEGQVALCEILVLVLE